MKQLYTTTLRLNLAKEEDRRAYERLQRLDRKRYRSVNQAVIAAVNGHFDRQEWLAADPYLETREKEDAFLRRVMAAIEAGLRAAPPAMLPPSVPEPEGSSEDMEAAPDFADNF